MSSTVIDELVVRLVTEGIAKAKAELAQSVKDAEAAQRRLDSLTDKAEAKRQKEAERAARRIEQEAARAAKLAEREAKKAETATAKRKAAAEKSTADFYASLQKIDGALTSVLQKAAAAVTAGFGAATAAVVSFANESSELKTAAAFASLTTDRLQELSYAAEQNGMSREKFLDGIRQFNAGVREGVKGGGIGSVAEGVNDLGLSFEKLARQSPEEQFLSILDAGNKAGPSMARAGAYAKIFGETAGAMFSRVSDQGRAAFEATAKEASKFGGVLSHDALESGVRLEQQIHTLKGAFGGLRNAIGVELTPIALEFVAGLRDWVHENRQLIATTTREWISGVVEVGRQFVPWLRTTLPLLIDIVKATKDWVPALVATTGALKGILAVKDVVTTVGALSGALTGATKAASGLAGFLGPHGAIFAGLTALIPLAYELGNKLGDIGNQDTGPRKNTMQRLAASKIEANGSFAGGEAFAAELATKSRAERQQLRTQALQDTDVTRRRATLRVLNDADFFASKRDKEEERKKDADALASSLSKFSAKELGGLYKSGQITKEQYELERGQRNSGRFLGKRPGAGDGEKPVSDEELAKLIASASKSGANLDEVLKGRKIAGNAPPVITVQVTNVKVDAPISVIAKAGQSVLQIAQEVSREFDENLGRALQRSMPTLRENR